MKQYLWPTILGICLAIVLTSCEVEARIESKSTVAPPASQPEAAPTPPVSPEAEEFVEGPPFAGLKFIRHCVYDSGTGVAIILTYEREDSKKALEQLLGRRQCWVDRFPDRAKRIRTASFASRGLGQSTGKYSWEVVGMPYAYVIEYGTD